MDRIIDKIMEILPCLLFFIVVGLIGGVGYSLNRFRTYARYGYGGKAALTGAAGIAGVLILIGIGFWLHSQGLPPLVVAGYAAVILVLLILGWNGIFIQPKTDDD